MTTEEMEAKGMCVNVQGFWVGKQMDWNPKETA
jgi:hypothetical protein